MVGIQTKSSHGKRTKCVAKKNCCYALGRRKDTNKVDLTEYEINRSREISRKGYVLSNSTLRTTNVGPWVKALPQSRERKRGAILQ
jgi:hypothetical protein